MVEIKQSVHASTAITIIAMAEKRSSDSAAVQQKKGKIQQTNKTNYTETWPVLTASKKRGVQFVHCCVCDVDFSIAHGGRDDCRRHVASKKHQ